MSWKPWRNYFTELSFLKVIQCDSVRTRLQFQLLVQCCFLEFLILCLS